MTLDNLTVNTVRFLCTDQIQKANSGHPGLPLGLAPTAFTLWSKAMSHNPKDPGWHNRDRFVLSAGHGSSMLYSLLHLFGYGLSIDDLKNFRQLDSKTPGHPEYGHTAGVEVTTGPLGQGIANAVGMAMAEKHLAKIFNTPDFNIVDHYTFAVCGDGCLMEGVASEAASLAGTLNLNKLIILYDSNNITIEGDTNIAFREDVKARFKAYGFDVFQVMDGNGLDEILSTINEAKLSPRPALIEIKTKIGFGSPNKQGKASAHGEPLGADEIKLTKEALGFNYYDDFYVPDEVRAYMGQIIENLAQRASIWGDVFTEYRKQNPELAKLWDIYFECADGPDLLNNEEFWQNEGNLASRVSSEIVLNKVAKLYPNLIGGSADLSPSTKTIMKGRGDFSAETPEGPNLHFGIREHAMNAVANGIALHGGLKIYVSGFFVFSDYSKAAMRLSALMGIPVINIMTHDSIGVGEDGPTHQPVEQLTALRSIPNFTVIRPCDSNEVSAAWYLALNRKSPTAIVLTRQNLTLLKETGKDALKGGYILRDSVSPDIILMASGSEVGIIYEAFDKLVEKGMRPRVVSMPSMEVFEEQGEEYKESVFPKNIRKRVAVEAGAKTCWYKYVGLDGDIIGMDSFGASAPANSLFEKFGFTVDNVAEAALKL
ncbi:MAG: transketolase [Clostridiales bacterium]|jgi:transketolase|nr:transketolase [Clostridiales bacterium]